jgi:DNA-binding GntR family transcriptional regulator
MSVETGATRPMLRQVAYERFMDRLYAGKLRPGLLVSQRELCEELDVPMGPMREALKRLEAEAVVTLIPQRGIRILDVDEKTINDVFEMRLMIEPEAVQRFRPEGREAQVADLLARTRAAVEAPQATARLDPAEIGALTSLDHEMHRLFVNAMDNAVATDLFERMLGKLRLTRLVFRLRSFPDGGAAREHLEILDHVSHGRADAAGAAMERHLHASWRRALGLGA